MQTVISLLAPTEAGFDEEARKVGAPGLRFVSIPVGGAAGVTKENALALDAALREASGKVILHCGSGNRAGALIALRAFHAQKQNRAQAFSEGERAGLTRLKQAVSQHFAELCAKEAGYSGRPTSSVGRRALMGMDR